MSPLLYIVESVMSDSKFDIQLRAESRHFLMAGMCAIAAIFVLGAVVMFLVR